MTVPWATTSIIYLTVASQHTNTSLAVRRNVLQIDTSCISACCGIYSRHWKVVWIWYQTIHIRVSIVCLFVFYCLREAFTMLVSLPSLFALLLCCYFSFLSLWNLFSDSVNLPDNFTGPLLANNYLSQADHLFVKEIRGPECFSVWKGNGLAFKSIIS